MSLSAAERRSLLEGLRLEAELAPGAALASDAAEQFDVPMARLLACGDLALLGEALAYVGDPTEVLSARAPYEPLEGGYGRHFGTVTVGDKALFLLKRLLGPERAEAAIARGPAWLEGRPLRWDTAAQRFV